jgi:ELWxxDGT repeat protein
MKSKNWYTPVLDLALLALLIFALSEPARGAVSYGEPYMSITGSVLFTPYLVKDIDTTASSHPAPLVGMNGTLYFEADDGSNGDELWKSDGTEAGTMMVHDINPGTDSGITDEREKIYNLNGILLIAADDGTHGEELWISDGTSAGTALLKDINTSGDSDIYFFGDDGNGMLYFRATDGAHGEELWKTDGTPAGTVMVKDIWSGSTGSYPEDGVFFDGVLYFDTDDDMHGGELWKSDGTEGGTAMVKDIRPGSARGLYDIAVTDNQLFLYADDGVHGGELWRSDGTAANTVLVQDINPSGDARIIDMTAVGSVLFFCADDGASGGELWVSDGTPGGTQMVKDINSTGGSGPRWLTRVENVLFFIASDDVHGVELWKSDGTPEGTVMVRDIYTGSDTSNPFFLTGVGSKLYFTAEDGTHGYELWQSDGTEAGTMQVMDINPGSDYSSPSGYLGVGSLLFFEADDGVHDNELWAYQIEIPNNPPYAPSNPVPAHQAVDVPPGNLLLEWIGGDPDLTDTVTYDIYLATVPTLTLTESDWSVLYYPIITGENTHHYWQIVAKDNYGNQTPGPIWEFTTGSAGNINKLYLPFALKDWQP